MIREYIIQKMSELVSRFTNAKVCYEYDNIADMNRFMPLNPKTHEVIHEVFKWYKKDHKVLDRIKKTLDLMEEYTGEVLHRDNKVETQKDRKHLLSDNDRCD